jgi:hypothetical protein
MKIGFLNNQIDYRGTGNAVFDYAHYNEEILGNKSYIFTFRDGKHNKKQMDRFITRFGEIFFLEDGIPSDTDAIYHIKYGGIDIDLSDQLPYWVHAVFDGSQPHGTRYAVISPWMSAVYDQSYVPHIVNYIKVPKSESKLVRLTLGIPRSAVLIGRIGGVDTFDIDFVRDTMIESLDQRKDLHYLFIGPVDDLPKHERIHTVDLTVDPYIKTSLISACDAMIHARIRGETFGIGCAEFANQGLPVITYKNSGEKAHLLELEKQPEKWFYTDKETLLNALLSVTSVNKAIIKYGYYYNPVPVMEIFKKVFINGEEYKYDRSEPKIGKVNYDDNIYLRGV